MFEPDLSDEVISLFTRPEGNRLMVTVPSPSTDTVGEIVLSTCWWEMDPRADQRDSVAEQLTYDEAYFDALRVAEAVAGAAYVTGRDRPPHAHRWALWRGRTGLFVVQQGAYDPQFGVDVNYWVRPWGGGDPLPTDPFLEWLMS